MEIAHLWHRFWAAHTVLLCLFFSSDIVYVAFTHQNLTDDWDAGFEVN